MRKTLLLALLFMTAPAYADKGPSASTTAYFIDDLIDPRLPTYPEGTYMHYRLAIGKDPCNPVHEGYTDTLQMHTPLPMRKLAVNNVEVIEWPEFPTPPSPVYAINLHSRGNEGIFFTSTTIRGVRDSSSSGRADFALHVKGGSKYNAEKMAKALKHLAKLCGAKDDIF